MPTYEEYSSDHEQEQTEPSSGAASEEQPSSSAEQLEVTPTHSHHTTYASDGSSEVSFMPQAGMSSTPATAFRQRSQEDPTGERSQTTPSWSASLESPLLRLAGEVQSLGQADEVSAVSERTARYDNSEDITQRAIPPPNLSIQTQGRDVSPSKGKGREMPSPLLQGVLRRNANLSDVTSPRKLAFSPLKVKPKTPIAKTMNPYLPPGSKPTDWKGVVNLSDPSSTTPQKGFSSASLDRTARQLAQGSQYVGEDSFETDFGMSPPVTMDFARLPKLGKTPKKEAAARIFQGLLDIEKRGVFAAPPAAGTLPGGKANTVESSGSSMPTPPSLSRYQPDPQSSASGSSIVDASLERMMRQVGIISDSETGGSQSSTDRPSLHSQGLKPTQPPPKPAVSSSIFPKRPPTFTAIQRPPPPVAPPPAPETPPPPQFDIRRLRDDSLDGGGMDHGDLDDSLDDDSFSAVAQGPVFPHPAGDYDEQDDSFASDSTDSFGDDDLDGAGPAIEVYPAEGDSFDDDSFDNDFDGPPEEETVFGVRPAERLRMQGRESEGNLRMYGADLFLGVGSQAGRVEDTPTPIIPPK